MPGVQQGLDRPPAGIGRSNRSSVPERSVGWRINAERLMLLGWSRAILLQLAHPLVAEGHRQHGANGVVQASDVRAMLSVTFGDDTAREQTFAVIRAIHRRVHGRLPLEVGRFAAGTPYSAEDPELVLWVHATLLDSLALAYDRLVSPLSRDERDAFCIETASTATALGARDPDVPRTWDGLSAYMEAMVRSDAIVVGDQARQMAAAVLAPPVAVAVWPAAQVNRLVTVGLLPAAVREGYGFTWSARDERRLARVLGAIGYMRRGAPRWLAHGPDARRS
jgi:uncharacterized protein (DUF2236 family)